MLPTDNYGLQKAVKTKVFQLNLLFIICCFM